MGRISGAVRESVEFGRGLGFFDAVFGFAITLLIANVDPPSPEAWQGLDALMASGAGTQLMGYAISFAVIAVFWKANYDLLARFTAITGPVIAANLVTAAFVVLIPFTTQGMSDPRSAGLPLPVALYSLNIALAILAQAVMFEVGRREGLVAAGAPASVLWAARVDVLAKIAVFLLAIPVAMWCGADWGRLCWAALIVVAPLTGRWSARVEARAVTAQA